MVLIGHFYGAIMTDTANPVATASNTSPIVTDTANQPVVTTPIVEQAAPAAEPIAAPPVDAAAPPLAENPLATTPEWAMKRINELTFKRHEAERKAQTEKDGRLAAEAKTAELLSQLSKPADNATPKPATKAVSDEEIEQLANERAVLIAKANKFNETCNTIVETGKKEYKDTWDNAIKNLSLVGAIGKDVSPEFLETAVELKNPVKVLHYLGSNLEEAERISQLPPKKMALEMARMEALLEAPPAAPPVSNAPPPVIPVGGAAKPGAKALDDPNLTTEEFMALRSQQVEEKRSRYKRA